VQKIKHVFPSRADIKLILPTVIRSGLIGTFIGSIPGAGTDIGAFVSYNEAKRWSKHKEEFGEGAIEGIAAPEAGNNGVTGGAMIPLLTLGIPGDAVAAIMLGALTIQGLQPGPLLFTNNAVMMYTIFIGFLLANICLMILGMSGIRLFTKITQIPRFILMPIIMVLCIVGSYAINNSMFDVYVMFIAGIVGFFMIKVDIPTSPLILALILGSMAESNFRRSLLLFSGSYSQFVTRPISVFFLAAAVLTLLTPILSKVVKSVKAQRHAEKKGEKTE
jgi:putative tricarboxylic transport membrane protein